MGISLLFKETFGKEPQKYITIILDKEHPKIFGYDRVDTSRTFYVVEAIDSLFVENLWGCRVTTTTSIQRQGGSCSRQRTKKQTSL